MIITCPHCGKRHKLPEDWSANKVRCSRCGDKFFLDELASEFITPDESPRVADDVRSQNPRPSNFRLVTSSATILRLSIGIAAVLIIAGAAAFYFLHVAPENKFRQAMREAEDAENGRRWDEALNAYYRAERIKPHDANAANAWQRIEGKRRIAEYAEAMARGKAAEQSNNWEVALREYQTVLMRKSDDAEAKASVTHAQYQLRMKEGREAEQQQRWDTALIAYSQALAVKPGDAEATEAEQRVRKFRAESEAKKVAFQEPPQVAQSKSQLPPAPEHATPSFSPESKAAALEQKIAPPLLSPKQTKEAAVSRNFVGLPARPPEEQIETLKKLVSNKAEDKIAFNAETAGVANGPWAVRRYYAAKDNEAALRRLIAEDVLIADHLTQQNLEDRKRALDLALQAALCATERLKDGGLAVKILDAYVMPNLDVTETSPMSWLSSTNVLEKAAYIYSKAGEKEKAIEAYKTLLANPPDNPNKTDAIRHALALLYEKNGRYEDALALLKQIDSNNGMGGARQLIPEIELKMRKSERRNGGR